MTLQYTYVVHPTGSVTAAELAGLYGLGLGEYVTPTAQNKNDTVRYIHLHVREDENYQDIKYLLGDTLTPGDPNYEGRVVRRHKNGTYVPGEFEDEGDFDQI